MKLMAENWKKFINESDTAIAVTWVEWLKGLSQDMARPLGWRISQDKGTICCWCGIKVFAAGVEHIIPRGSGGPPRKRWNLAWACNPCNQKRGSDIGSAPSWREEESYGWLYREFQNAPPVPTKEQLMEYFRTHEA